jgi:Uri superfamily endonuclease
MKKYYAGIGSRKTPVNVLERIERYIKEKKDEV